MNGLTYRLAAKGDGPLIADFFLKNVDESYVTASEVIWGRASADGRWNDNLFEMVSE